MFLGIIGIIIAAIGIFFVASSIDDLINGSDTDPGILWGLLVFFAILTGAGSLLAWNALRWSILFLLVPAIIVTIIYFILRDKNPRNKNWDKIDLENRVLDAAEKAGGRVTVAIIAVRCKLSVEEARSILEELSSKGAAEPQVTASGDIIYLFSGFTAEEATKLENITDQKTEKSN